MRIAGRQPGVSGWNIGPPTTLPGPLSGTFSRPSFLYGRKGCQAEFLRGSKPVLTVFCSFPLLFSEIHLFSALLQEMPRLEGLCPTYRRCPAGRAQHTAVLHVTHVHGFTSCRLDPECSLSLSASCSEAETHSSFLSHLNRVKPSRSVSPSLSVFKRRLASVPVFKRRLASVPVFKVRSLSSSCL